MTRMRWILCALAALCIAGSSAAQEFPARPVHLVVPYTPGTGADLLARILGPRLSERWKVAVVTENKPGATGNIGTDFVAKAPADGYTLLFTATSFATNPSLTRSLPFDPLKSFTPVIVAATSALAIMVNPQVPARSLREFLELARRQPGELHYSSPGAGGVQHLAMELIKLEAGIDVVHVPYKGLGGAISDLIGGHVQASVSALQSVAPHVHSGKLRMLAVMSAERSPAFPDVPTLKEQGLKDLEVETWYGVFGPAGMPASAAARINQDFDALLKEGEIRELLARQGMSAAGGSPERFEALVKRELERWARVVAAAGIKPE
jgi:tripartite-type tricarboxylate transporter receptor subunit TctC